MMYKESGVEYSYCFDATSREMSRYSLGDGRLLSHTEDLHSGFVCWAEEESLL
jgi:hypothetical protein